MTSIVTPNYKVLVYTPLGTKIAEIVNYLDLVYAKEVNAPGLAQITLPANHYVIPMLEDKAQVEIYRCNPIAGIDWYKDFSGLYRCPRRTYRNSELFTMLVPGDKCMLGWRHVLYYMDTANRSLYTSLPAETIMKSLVTYNCTSAGTVLDGRLRLATITPGTITVAADLAQGNTINSYACAYRNVLTELQKLAGDYGGGDFGMSKTGDATWEFRFYPGQLGTDRTSSVIFSIDYGNMANPEYTYNQINVATLVCVGGQGTGAARAIRMVKGPDYDVATNNIETFADGRNLSAVAALTDLGTRVANDKKAREVFNYDVMQTASCRYGRDYFLGDLVTAVWGDIDVTQQIMGVTVTARTDGSENIDVKTRTR